MVVGKVGVVMILFTVQVSVPVGFRVFLGMLARISSTRALSSSTKRSSDGLHRTLILGWNVLRMPRYGPFRIVPKAGRTYLKLDTR